MRKTLLTALAGLAMIITGGLAQAGGHAAWTLEAADSKIAFGSVKKNSAGESHHFTELSGTVSEGGDLAITINLASIETWIDIRNERVAEHVFHNMTDATMTAKMDMDALGALPVGGMTTVPVNATLSLMGTDVVIQTDMFVVRLAENRIMATTDEMAWLTTEEMGINSGVDKLMELAKLPGITRTVPFTARLVFSK